MAINIKNIAKKEITISELMEGREKIETRDIIKYYPNGIHINKCERVTTEKDGKPETFYIYLFDEEPERFAFSGYILNKIFNAILEACEGDFSQMNEELAEQKLTVKLSESKTKSNKQPITLVEVV